MKINAVIIEDEKPAVDLILKFLEEKENINIMSVCNDGFSGLKACSEYKPDLIFLDIQMPKLNGFELLEVIDPIPYIIFTTAYDEYAINAFEANAVDYLLKPFSKERFFESIDKVFSRMNNSMGKQLNIKSLIENRQGSSENLSRVVVKSGSNIHIIDTDDIVYIESDGDYVRIYTENDRFLKENTMKFYETRLNSSQFIRIHRSRILNINYLNKIELYQKESYMIHLKTGINLKASLSGYKLLKNRLGF